MAQEAVQHVSHDGNFIGIPYFEISSVSQKSVFLLSLNTIAYGDLMLRGVLLTYHTARNSSRTNPPMRLADNVNEQNEFRSECYFLVGKTVSHGKGLDVE